MSERKKGMVFQRGDVVQVRVPSGEFIPGYFYVLQPETDSQYAGFCLVSLAYKSPDRFAFRLDLDGDAEYIHPAERIVRVKHGGKTFRLEVPYHMAPF